MPEPTAASAAAAMFASMVLSWVCVRGLRVFMPRWGFVDVPNARSSHRRPTPRAGGVAFAVISPIVALVVWNLTGVPAPQEWLVLILGAWIVAATGLLDDRFGLTVIVRAGAYSTASVIFMVGGGYLTELQWAGLPPLSLGWLGPVVTFVWLAGLTNAYNFMDGIDGIAGAQAVVAAGAAALLASSNGDHHLAILAASLAGGALGFLMHNWPPARIFMGDAGSAFLGFSFAGLAVLSAKPEGGTYPFWIWLMLLTPFLFDSTLTLGLRIVRGERWYEPHRQHLYQRLIRRGCSHIHVTSVYLTADLFLAGSIAAYSVTHFSGAVLALLTCVPPITIYGLVRVVERRKAVSDPSPQGSHLA